MPSLQPHSTLPTASLNHLSSLPQEPFPATEMPDKDTKAAPKHDTHSREKSNTNGLLGSAEQSAVQPTSELQVSSTGVIKGAGRKVMQVVWMSIARPGRGSLPLGGACLVLQLVLICAT